MKSSIVVIVLVIYVGLVYGQNYAIDLPASQIFTIDQFTCLYNQGFTVFVPEIYSSNGEFSSIGIQNLVNAQQVAYTNANINPCVNGTCKNGLVSGRDQALAVLNGLSNANVHTYLNLQVQGFKNWPKDQVANQKFIMDFTNTIWEAFKEGNSTSGIDILTSYNDWSNIVGPNFTGASAMDLVWVNWNGKQDLTTGWTPFGGWKTPCWHQYAGNIFNNNCTRGVPINYDIYGEGECACQEQACYSEFHNRRMVKFASKL